MLRLLAVLAHAACVIAGRLEQMRRCVGRPLSGNELPEDSKVPPAVRQTYTKFWR